jgi:hypothetical protein
VTGFQVASVHSIVLRSLMSGDLLASNGCPTKRTFAGPTAGTATAEGIVAAFRAADKARALPLNEILARREPTAS